MAEAMMPNYQWKRLLESFLKSNLLNRLTKMFSTNLFNLIKRKIHSSNLILSTGAQVKLKQIPHIKRTRNRKLKDSYFTPYHASTAPHLVRRDQEDEKIANPIKFYDLITTYSQLSKSRLAALVVLTTMSGYAMAPTACSASPTLLMTTALGFPCLIKS
jgi:hypothetical protein